MQKLLKFKRLINLTRFFCVLSFLLMSTFAHAADKTALLSPYLDRTNLIMQQTELLKNRLAQAQSQLATLQRQDENQSADFSLLHPSKEVRSQAALNTAVAKSNVDSINIELSESQQTVNRLEKDAQEIENQLNVFSIFGLKIARTETMNVPGLQAEFDYQQNLIELEKTRAGYLKDLQKIAENTFQLQKTKYARINAFLKSRTIMQLKERQAKSESVFQQQQSVWLQRLNNLYVQLGQLDAGNIKDKSAYGNMQREIFYANENLNLAYLQMLLVRYQDQLQQLRIAVAHSSSITLLNKANDQILVLSKQLVRVDDLLKARVKILAKRKLFLVQNNSNTAADKADSVRLTELSSQYDVVSQNMDGLGQKILAFRYSLDKSLQYELSSRQGLPGFSGKAWVDLGAELWLVPSLTYQMVKSLFHAIVYESEEINYLSVLVIALLEICMLVTFMFANKLLARLASGMAEHELGHINLTRLSIQLLRRNFVDIFVIINLFGLFSFSDIPTQSSGFVINLALVWLFFKVVITMARVCLVETAHDYAGHDVILYHRLKWSFLVGGVITALTVFMHQLPVIYEVKDLFDRMFLMFLLVVSVFLLKSWEIVPGLILPHIDDRRLYLKKVVRLLGLLIPLILLINTAIGLFGFVNLVLTISWYESIFVFVLVGYLVMRGLLNDAMMVVSTMTIRHVMNGWLWTEAFLKPIDRVLRAGLFLGAWVVLFAFYGWNQQSPVVVQLNNLLHYHIIDLLNTSITLLGLLEVAVVVSLTFWSARWVREFVYRLLSSRTQDMGLRNSIAIFSQYATIIIGVLICLKVLGIDFGSLKVVAGAFAFGVGLGLRDLFNNFACGFLLLIERPLRVGDTVSINGHEGEVLNIGSRAVTIKTWDHMDVYVPNAEIFSKSFTNWTGKDSIVRSVVTIKINRHDSPEEVQALIHKVLASTKDVLRDPAPEVFLKELSDALVELEVRYFINLRQIKSRIGLRSEVLMAIWATFERHGIQPPYPHQEVHLRGEFPVPVAYDKNLIPASTMNGILPDLGK
jgi:potassium efflux system protein